MRNPYAICIFGFVDARNPYAIYTSGFVDVRKPHAICASGFVDVRKPYAVCTSGFSKNIDYEKCLPTLLAKQAAPHFFVFGVLRRKVESSICYHIAIKRLLLGHMVEPVTIQVCEVQKTL